MGAITIRGLCATSLLKTIPSLGTIAVSSKPETLNEEVAVLTGKSSAAMVPTQFAETSSIIGCSSKATLCPFSVTIG